MIYLILGMIIGSLFAIVMGPPTVAATGNQAANTASHSRRCNFPEIYPDNKALIIIITYPVRYYHN